MPEERGTPPFITFKSEVANAIGDCRRAIIREGGRAVRELETLRAMLHPWGKDDRAFGEATRRLESEMLKAEGHHTWPRPNRPWWLTRYFGMLLDLAKSHGLLDIEAITHLDDDGEL